MSLANRTPHPFRPSVTILGLVVFAVGTSSSVILNFVGELYVVEVILPLLALAILFFTRGWRLLGERPFMTMAMAFGMMLGGYMISDLVVSSRPDQFMRGWGRILLVTSDFIAYYVILAKDRKLLWWLTLGMGVGGVAFLYANGAPLTRWKIGYAEQVVPIVLALSCFLPGRLKALPIVALAPISMWLDYRSFAAMCLAVGGYLWIVSGRRGLLSMNRADFFKFALAGCAILALTNWMLEATEDDDTLKRRADSNAGRGASVESALIAIERSPLIGYGSWSEDAELARTQRKLEQTKMGDAYGSAQAGKLFVIHSQILGAWVEGGILAAGFFFFLLYRLVATGRWIVFDRAPDLLSAIMVAYLFMTGWNGLMSPFSGLERMLIGIGAAILVVSEIDRRHANRRKRSESPGRSVEPRGKRLAPIQPESPVMPR